MKTPKTISCRVTGYRKLMEGKPCEDATRVIHIKNATIMAVADGHGDCRCIFAHIGSQLAVRAACEALKAYNKKMKNEDPSVYWNSRRTEIAQCVVQTFSRFAVSDYVSRCPGAVSPDEQKELIAFIDGVYTKDKEVCTPEQIRQKYTNKKRLGDKLQNILYLYGTTIHASLIAENYMFHMALGDGDTMILVDDRAEWALPKSEMYERETVSLCEDPETILNDFMFSYMEVKPKGSVSGKLDDMGVFPQMIVLSTDGLRNSFYSERAFGNKIKEVEKCAENEGKHLVKRLKVLFARLTRESVFQDDISAIFLWL